MINDDDSVPTSQQFVQCTTIDIAYALNEAAKMFVHKATAVLMTNSTTLDNKKISSAENSISVALVWFRRVSQEEVVRLGIDGDRDVMVEHLITCLDNIKDLEYEIV